MPSVALTVEQLVDAVNQLTARERQRFDRQLAARHRAPSANDSGYEALRKQADYKFSAHTQRRLSGLLAKQREEKISATESAELETRLAEYDRRLVEKARARRALKVRSGKPGDRS